MSEGTNRKLKGLLIGMLLVSAFLVTNRAWAPWVPIEGQRDPGLDPIKNTEGAIYLAPLHLDTNDFPHIAWSNDSGICYLKWNGSEWVDVDGSGQESIKVPGTDRVRSSFSLCVDSAGHPYIAWDRSKTLEEIDYVFPVSEVYCLRWNGSEWVDADGTGQESMKVGTDYGLSFPSLCLDSNDFPHLLVEKEYSSLLAHPQVCYLRWNGSQWVENGDPRGSEGVICDVSKGPESLGLRLDSNNQPHIVLAAGEGYDHIIYVYWNAEYKLWGRWPIRCKESESYHVPSFCLDSKNRPHIAFCVETEASGFPPHWCIYYLWWEGSAWVDVDGTGRESEKVSSEQDNSAFPSLGLDSRGYPHIAWLDKNEGKIRYLRWDGNKWIDPELSALPKFVELLRDKWKQRQWWTSDFLANVQEAVEAQEFRTSIGESAKSPFLCLDSKGNPHIAWIDDTEDKKQVFHARWISAEDYRDKSTHYIKGYVKDKNGRPAWAFDRKLLINN